jgi:hypothetical protein
LNQGPSGYEPDELPRQVFDITKKTLLSLVVWA